VVPAVAQSRTATPVWLLHSVSSSRPFVLAPAGFDRPSDEIVGAEAMHRIMRGWLAGVGHPAYRVEAGQPVAQPG
jgi:hypothetical protein